METDRYGNSLDPIVRYARGTILKGTDEEVARMLRARQLVGERVRAKGRDSVYDLSGMNRGSGITESDVPLSRATCRSSSVSRARPSRMR